MHGVSAFPASPFPGLSGVGTDLPLSRRLLFLSQPQVAELCPAEPQRLQASSVLV